MYWPLSTISEILRSTARLESRYASSRLKVVALDHVIDHRAHGALGGVEVAADASGPIKRCRVDAWDLPPDRLTRRQMTGATGGTENVLFAVRGGRLVEAQLPPDVGPATGAAWRMEVASVRLVAPDTYLRPV
jgi:hypothetical protein